MAQASEHIETKHKVTPVRTEKKATKTAPARVVNPFEEMEQFMERIAPSGWMRPWRWEWPSWSGFAAPFEGRMPKMDVIDRDNEIVVRAELPGVDKKDLDVSMTDNTVTIKGETRKEEKEEKGDYYRCEISEGSFSRTVTLPSDVDASKAQARFKDGMLELTLPKAEGSKRRTIKVD